LIPDVFGIFMGDSVYRDGIALGKAYVSKTIYFEK